MDEAGGAFGDLLDDASVVSHLGEHSGLEAGLLPEAVGFGFRPEARSNLLGRLRDREVRGLLEVGDRDRVLPRQLLEVVHPLREGTVFHLERGVLRQQHEDVEGEEGEGEDEERRHRRDAG